jgi:para-aminobenzoate synthetase component I
VSSEIVSPAEARPGPAPRGQAVGALPVVEELTPTLDPLDALDRLRDLPYVLLLDSASDPERLGRYSFLTADPSTVVTAKDGQTVVHSPSTTGGSPRSDDPLLVVRALMTPFHSPPVPGLPPFQGGAAGYIGYDYGAWLERLPRPRYDDLDIPDVMLGLYDWVLAWDHQSGRSWLLSTGAPELKRPARDRRARERLGEIRRRLAGPPRAHQSHPGSSLQAGDEAGDEAGERPRVFAVPGHPGLGSSFSRVDYLEAVRRVREYIFAGDIFQANLSQRFEAAWARDPLALYRRLRVLNPAPFAAYLEAPGLSIVSASPERFMRVDVGGAVEARPIKGTSPRGIGPEHDAHLGRALTESPKDRAENLMIVDLLRNDLSRMCRPGTVRVPELFALEHYSTVHHLVSTVVGQLADGADGIDLVRAAFPGGSITGAPKVRAMEIIAELEPSRRGVYCGSVGYLSGTGAADTSIVIRTYLIKDGRAFFSAGGGIVADSDPEAEYLETLDKARALIAAVDMGSVAHTGPEN